MKRIARVLALIAGLLPTLAAAQQALPANTVWGRLAVPSTGGPAQAIPFATLFANAGIAAGPQSCSTHNWFNSLSSAGAFGCAQPSFADLTGQATFAQLPNVNADNLIGNPTGSAAAPTNVPLVNCTGGLTYSTSTHSIGCNSGAGTGTVTEQKNTASGGLSTSGNCDNTTTNAGSPCNYAMSLNSAVVEVNTGLTTSIPGTTATMMGWGASCHITPTYSTRIEIEMTGTMSEVSGGGLTLTARWGTGTAPSNSGAAAGTVVGSGVSVNGSGSTGVSSPFKIGGIVTGLTVGVAVWFDAIVGISGSTSLANPSCRAHEVL